MSWDEKFQSVRSKLAALPRLLTQREAAGKFVFNLFSFIYHHTFLSRMLALLIYAALLYAVNSVVNMHKGLVPPSGPWHWFYHIALPAIALLVALILYTIPLMLIAHFERYRDTILSQVGLGLDRISRELMHPGANERLDFDKIEDAFDAIIASVERGGGTNCILTPNAFYLRADNWRAYLKEHLPTDGPLNQIKLIADRAPSFRDALKSFKGDLHFILPDPEDGKVQEFFRSRALFLGLPENVLIDINSDAVTWVKRDIRPYRNKRGRKTLLHLTNRLPTFRFMMLDNLCFMQPIPTERFGVGQHIVAIRREEHPKAFAGIECGLKVISKLF